MSPKSPFRLFVLSAAASCALAATVSTAQMQEPPPAPAAAMEQQAAAGQAIVTAPPEALPEQHVTLSAPTDRLSYDARLLLVLSRFTYGPRPGDLDHLRQIGLNAWFTQQMNPASIDDRALDERLKMYPAMQLSLDKLFGAFPSPDEVIASMFGRGTTAASADAGGRAILRHREEDYRNNPRRKPGAGPSEPVSLPKPAAEILAMDPPARYKELLKLTSLQLRELNREMLPADRAHLTDGFTPQQWETFTALDAPTQVVASEVIQTKLLRDIYTERQLQEVMTDFWLNHFNIYMRKNAQEPYYLASYVRDVVRPLALGHFEALLIATAESPAMLTYLDQQESIGPHSDYANAFRFRPQQQSGLNENYAREVMELHTIGVDGGYTQKDVTELAKVLTGWTIQQGYRTGTPTHAVYDFSKHEPGKKVVLGQTIPYRGPDEGYQVLRMLAESPQCAHFISQKLAVHFVSDDPPKAMVDRMAARFLATHGDIRQVLITMINSPEFFTTETFRSKVKTPQEFVVSAIRATGAEVDNPLALVNTLNDLGMPVFGHLTPEGYSLKNEAWSSTTALVSRMNFSMALATNRVQGIHTDLSHLTGGDATQMSAREKQQLIEARLLHIHVSDKTEQLISSETSAPPEQQRAQLAQITAVRTGGARFARFQPERRRGPMGSDLNERDLPVAMATGLVLGSPEFQRR